MDKNISMLLFIGFGCYNIRKTTLSTVIHMHGLVHSVLEAVRLNPPTARATNVELESAIMSWLRLASDRDGGRERRAAMKRQRDQGAVPAGGSV